MNESWESLIANGLLSVPDDFVERVLGKAEALPQQPSRNGWRQYLQWLAAFAAASLGLEAALSFMFGLWMAGIAF